MKRYATWLLLLFLFTLNTECKSQKEEFVLSPIVGFYGIHIVGGIKNMYSPTNGSDCGTGGMSGGIHVKRDLSKKVYAAFDLRYIHKGSIYEYISAMGTEAFESIKLNDIEIPLLIGFKKSIKKRFLFVETGPVYARMMSAKMIQNEMNRWDYSENFRSFKRDELSWTGGIKYSITQNNKFMMGLRYSRSIFSIHKLYKLYNLNYGVEFYYIL